MFGHGGKMKNIIVGYVLPLFLCGVGLIMFQFESLSFMVGLIFIALAIVIFVWNIFIIRRKKPTDTGITLKDIGKCKTDNECALWDYGKYGYSAIPLNDTWQQWISSGNGKYGLVVTVNRPDLDYYNFGNEFYFVDLKTNKKISIPTGNRARNEQVGNLFHNGMVVRLMPRTI